MKNNLNTMLKIGKIFVNSKKQIINRYYPNDFTAYTNLNIRKYIYNIECSMTHVVPFRVKSFKIYLTLIYNCHGGHKLKYWFI